MLVLGLVVAGVVAFIVWPREREPEYQGKKLSEWILVYNSSEADSATRHEAPEAVRQIGADALTWLLKWMQYREPPWKSNLFYYFQKLPPAFKIRVIERSLAPVSQNRPQYVAVWGFWILHEQAAPAVPELARLAHDSRRPALAAEAMRCLFAVGEAGLPALRTAFHSPDPALRAIATNALGGLRSELVRRAEETGTTPRAERQNH
jgi:hypothetical protein